MASTFNSGFVWDHRYIVSEAVGNGAFGTVWRAVERESGEPCAIKRVALDERYQNRELSMMQQLSHENVVRLRNWFSTNEGDCTWLHLVMDFMPCTLRSLQARILQQQRGFPPLLLKILMWQLLQALRYIHDAGIAHRDLKPDNVLCDPRTHKLQLCDFGCSKRLVSGKPNIFYICALFYRAPELLLGATTYGAPVDCWALGCMFGELLLHRPLMPGTSELRQLELMCALLGTPSAAIWPEFPALPLTPKVQLPAQPYNELPSRLAKARPTGAALDLVGALLTYDPARRCTADGALAHGYFAEPPAAVVPDMCRAAPSSAKESEPAGLFAPEKGAENRCAALLPTAAPARKRPREARLPSPASVAAEEPRKL